MAKYTAFAIVPPECVCYVSQMMIQLMGLSRNICHSPPAPLLRFLPLTLQPPSTTPTHPVVTICAFESNEFATFTWFRRRIILEFGMIENFYTFISQSEHAHTHILAPSAHLKRAMSLQLVQGWFRWILSGIKWMNVSLLLSFNRTFN